MKRIIAILLTMLLMVSWGAQAENTLSVYDALTRLIDGRQFTLTVTIESEEDLPDILQRFAQVTCSLCQENELIILHAVCEGDAFLHAYATAEGVNFETNLIEKGTFQSDWASLAPVVSMEANQMNISMTGPDHELIRFTCKVTGSDFSDCRVEVNIGFITGPGNVHSLWDGITHEDGDASREFYFTFSEEEYVIEGEGTTSVDTAEDGTTVISRQEQCTITHNEDELGTVIFFSTLTIQ